MADRRYNSGDRVAVSRSRELMLDELEEAFYERSNDTQQALAVFRSFLRTPRSYPLEFRNQVVQSYRLKKPFVSLSLDGVASFPRGYCLLKVLLGKPFVVLPKLEHVLKDELRKRLVATASEPEVDAWDVQLLLERTCDPRPFDYLRPDNFGKVFKVAGVVTRARDPYVRATRIPASCGVCSAVQVAEPSSLLICRGCGARGKFVPLHDSPGGTWVDEQILTLQEFTQDALPGQVPRSVQVVTSRSLVDKVVPGTRVAFLGALQPKPCGTRGYQRGVGPPAQFYALGYERLGGHTNVACTFSDVAEMSFRKLAASPDVYETLASEIAPGIGGRHTLDVKKILLCQLLGGVSKTLPDGARLRGEIHVLLLGDPSLGKSQFLKFVEKAAPVGVFTSGKSCSAAGLTASVTRSVGHSFLLEPGALIRSDGGVACIDEFDKTNPSDRVALHEAMEQQTISIAKAGINTVLHSRASVLAAANPVYGTFDPEKTIREQVNLEPTLLSRFDVICVVTDDRRNVERDREVVRHVLNFARGFHSSEEAAPTQLAGYLKYCRKVCAPVLTEASSDYLLAQYLDMRQEVAKLDLKGDSFLPVGIRQLEALIRLSEALAKMKLQSHVTREHAEEAVRLYKVSTWGAVQSDAGLIVKRRGQKSHI